MRWAVSQRSFKASADCCVAREETESLTSGAQNGTSACELMCRALIELFYWWCCDPLDKYCASVSFKNRSTFMFHDQYFIMRCVILCPIPQKKSTCRNVRKPNQITTHREARVAFMRTTHSLASIQPTSLCNAKFVFRIAAKVLHCRRSKPR